MALSTADSLSLLRIALALPTAWFAAQGRWELAAGAFGLAAMSDLLDGPAARRAGTPRPRGALLDHGADAWFVTAVLGALAWRGVLSPLLPALIVLAFTQYVWDSKVHRGAALRGNPIGRINGIAYYVLAGAWIASEGWFPALREMLSVLSLGLIATTAFSMSQRWRART